MPAIMIQCPKTKQPIPTGMSMDKGSFATSSLSGNNVSCRLCNGTHTWDKKDAFLADN